MFIHRLFGQCACSQVPFSQESPEQPISVSHRHLRAVETVVQRELLLYIEPILLSFCVFEIQALALWSFDLPLVLSPWQGLSCFLHSTVVLGFSSMNELPQPRSWRSIHPLLYSRLGVQPALRASTYQDAIGVKEQPFFFFVGYIEFNFKASVCKKEKDVILRLQ